MAIAAAAAMSMLHEHATVADAPEASSLSSPPGDAVASLASWRRTPSAAVSPKVMAPPSPTWTTSSSASPSTRAPVSGSNVTPDTLTELLAFVPGPCSLTMLTFWPADQDDVTVML